MTAYSVQGWVDVVGRETNIQISTPPAAGGGVRPMWMAIFEMKWRGIELARQFWVWVWLWWWWCVRRRRREVVSIVLEVFRVSGIFGLKVWRELGSLWWRWWLRKVSCQKMGKAPQMLIAWWVALHFSSLNFSVPEAQVCVACNFIAGSIAGYGGFWLGWHILNGEGSRNGHLKRGLGPMWSFRVINEDF